MATVIHLPIARPAEPTIATTPSVSAVVYDVAINGMGFITATSSQTPAVRQTAQYRKDQTDNAQEAGEQSLDFWWLRSQASFHGGAGLLYFEQPVNPQGVNEITRVRFDASRNMDVWTPGKVTRLPDTTLVVSSGSASTALLGARQGANSYGVVAFGTALKAYKVPDVGSPSTITYTWGGVDAIQSVVSDGKSYYAGSASGIYSGPIDNGTNGAALWNSGAVVCLGWAKQRLMAGINNKVYELVGGAPPTLPTAKYTHPATDWVWTSFAESPAGILAAGYSGDESAIMLFTLDSSGVAPTLTSGVVAARLPVGERVYGMSAYTGSTLGIGTSKGVRVGVFSDAGHLTLGPLSVSTASPVKALTGRGDFLYATGSRFQDGESCLVRVDLGTPVDNGGHLAYASDLLPPAAQTGDCSGVSVLNGKMIFTVDGYGLLLEGTGAGTTGDAWLRTARIRYSTAEPKLFKFGRIRGDFPAPVRVYATTPSSTDVQILDLTSSLDDPPEFRLPAGGYEWIQLRFQMLSSAAHELRSYQLKALPGTKRQRLIQVPVHVADHVQDRNGKSVGSRGYGWARLLILEALEETGDVVVYESRAPYAVESRLCIIDQIHFEQNANATPVSGLSGVAMVTLRTVD
jgi:hypothetical protein